MHDIMPNARVDTSDCMICDMACAAICMSCTAIWLMAAVDDMCDVQEGFHGGLFWSFLMTCSIIVFADLYDLFGGLYDGLFYDLFDALFNDCFRWYMICL